MGSLHFNIDYLHDLEHFQVPIAIYMFCCSLCALVVLLKWIYVPKCGHRDLHEQGFVRDLHDQGKALIV